MGDQDAHTDEFILHLLTVHEERAISILYNLHAALLYRTAIRIVKEETVAHEIIQELFVNIWEKRRSLHLKSPLKSYLLRAVTNRCLNYLRDNRTRRNTLLANRSLLETTHILPEVEAKLGAADLKYLIRKTKRSLPPKTRIAFILSRSLNMSYKEISAHMGISQKAVEKHISRALTVFRKMRDDYLDSLLLLACTMYEMRTDSFFAKVGSACITVCW